MQLLLQAGIIYCSFAVIVCTGGYGGGHINDNGDVSAEGDAVNHPGMDATSKACRYDDGPGWSDCDPFELIRFRVLRLIHGGSQCEEMKNITKHCTPHDFPFGTHWLIQEHRKCIAELNRLKAMISDLHKFIETLHTKGKELFAAYLKLKAKLDDLKVTLDKLKVDGEHQQEVLTQLKEEIEEWKTKARDLQVQIDEVKTKYHDVQTEEHEFQVKISQLRIDINVLKKENEGIEKKAMKVTRENEELSRRIVESEHTKEKLKDIKTEKIKLEAKLERKLEYLEKLKDQLAEQRIQNLKNSIPKEEDNVESKDTHVDLSMEMFITHNKTELYKPTYAPVYYSTDAPYYKQPYEAKGKCLISYYGYTNETCWYETEGEKSEDSYVDALGHHLVEAHWKYFTIDVKDQAECDKASHLHYEFLINRCSPKHYLPVMAVFRAHANDKKLGTHFYPKIQASGGKNTCWITFLGAHGHCEAHNSKYDMYNTDDTPEGYSTGSGSDADKCIARAEWWMKFCDTPCLATYIPDGVSSGWNNDWIMHDSHGGRMFEETEAAANNINPDSLNPHSPVNPSHYPSEYKSQAAKTPDYHDSPEYRKSLHLEGAEKEAILKSLRERLGMSGAASGYGKDVLHHEGVQTYGGETKYESEGYSSQKSETYESQKYEAPKYESPKYEAPKYEAPKYEAPKYEAPTYEAPKYEEPKYEAPTEAPKYETPYEAPKYEAPTEAPYVTEAPTYDTEAPTYKTEAPVYETEAPKYETEAPKYEAEAPKYETEAPKYETEAPKYENIVQAPTYEAPKYEAPEEPKYEEPKYEEPASEEPKYQEHPPPPKYPEEPEESYNPTLIRK